MWIRPYKDLLFELSHCSFFCFIGLWKFSSGDKLIWYEWIILSYGKCQVMTHSELHDRGSFSKLCDYVNFLAPAPDLRFISIIILKQHHLCTFRNELVLDSWLDSFSICYFWKWSGDLSDLREAQTQKRPKPLRTVSSLCGFRCRCLLFSSAIHMQFKCIKLQKSNRRWYCRADDLLFEY